MSRYTLEKVNDGPDFTKLVYNLIFDVAEVVNFANNKATIDGIVVRDVGGVGIGRTDFLVASNAIVDISALEPTSNGSQVSGVSLISAVGMTNRYEPGHSLYMLLDSAGNEILHFPDGDFNLDFANRMVRSNQESGTNGDVYFAPHISGSNNQESVNVQLTFKKHY